MSQPSSPSVLKPLGSMLDTKKKPKIKKKDNGFLRKVILIENYSIHSYEIRSIFDNIFLKQSLMAKIKEPPIQTTILNELPRCRKHDYRHAYISKTKNIPIYI